MQDRTLVSGHMIEGTLGLELQKKEKKKVMHL